MSPCVIVEVFGALFCVRQKFGIPLSNTDISISVLGKIWNSSVENKYIQFCVRQKLDFQCQKQIYPVQC